MTYIARDGFKRGGTRPLLPLEFDNFCKFCLQNFLLILFISYQLHEISSLLKLNCLCFFVIPTSFTPLIIISRSVAMY